MAWAATHTFSVGEVLTANNMNLIQNNINAIASVGSYRHVHASATRAETVIDGGWLECNGTAVSRSTYSALFTKISTTYGSGDGSTTFNLPDAAGRVVVALAGTGGHADVTSLGAADSASLAGRRPKHNQTVASASTTDIAIGGNSNQPGSNSILGGINAGNRTLSTTVTVGPQTGNEPTDAPAYIVLGILTIKF